MPQNKKFSLKITTLFAQFNEQFFNNQLSNVDVILSGRLKTTSGKFCPQKPHLKHGEKNGIIELNLRLLIERTDKEIKETLLHEMIHAYLFSYEKRIKPHGKEFKQMSEEINKALDINISTRHKYFTWYRCEGKCKTSENRYFGYIKIVSSNTSRLKNSHVPGCDGAFKKVSEPSKNLLKQFDEQKKKIREAQKKVKKCKLQYKSNAFTFNSDWTALLPMFKHI
ncbi:CLUMA_CG007470, isoform A [Clunio marinus]|uniref:CLUMA_CG007470, isoform A n=1 Tax=Clunio marinus TaxID=568069 RepID=A0A1J1I0R7_9DIPT|nr:CLUMA_CG007470, isoform A [Clunio marinus]